MNETQLAVRVRQTYRAVQWAYEQIPEAIRQRATRANLLGNYAAAWPHPKPPTVTRYLRWSQKWADVKRELDEARPPDLTLKKVRRAP